ncbi:MAG: sigma-54 dependent transcriptional regulator [Pseudomonadota bacterium]
MEEKISVIVVDDDASVLRSWREIVSDERYRVALIEDPREALSHLESRDVDVAVVDIRMPEMDGMELLSRIKTKYPEVEVVMMTGFGGVQDAVEAIKRGAHDFLSKPFESMEATELTVRRAAEMRRLEQRVRQLEREMLDSKSVRPLVGQSPGINHVIELIRNVASSPATVLIHGENGTGKELVARAIHDNSPRARNPLVTLNCSALADTLLESELFGHMKGAFTGATTSHHGLFVAADGGTLFLDEIGDMPLRTQPKLLRAIQEGEVRPVGANKPINVDVRVIAATNMDLEQMSKAGAFRQDLYYRLNVVRIEIPPLRERKEDIPLLAHHFLLKHQIAVGKEFDGIDGRVLNRLSRFSWPGNVRELENAIERAVVMGRGDVIGIEDLPPEIMGIDGGAVDEDLTELPFSEAKTIAVQRFERVYLAKLMQLHRTVSAAAKAAGVDRSNFRRLLRRHELHA